MSDLIQHTVITAGTPESVTAEVTLPVGDAVFDGHFPTLPILPGVVQLNLVTDLVAKHLGQPVRLTGVPQMKFTEPLRPGDRCRLDVKLTPKAGALSAAFTISRARADGNFQACSAGRLNLSVTEH